MYIANQLGFFLVFSPIHFFLEDGNRLMGRSNAAYGSNRTRVLSLLDSVPGTGCLAVSSSKCFAG